MIKSKSVCGCNAYDNNKLQCDVDSEGYNKGKTDDNDWVDFDKELSEITTEAGCNNTMKQQQKHSHRSIAEAIIVINELPFTAEEKVEYIKVLMADKVQ